MLYPDQILQAEIVQEVMQWRHLWADSELDLVTFVASRRGGSQQGRVLAIYPGNLNVAARITFEDDGPDAIIRIPIPGVVAFRDEQVNNEAHFMMFVRAHAILPLPRIIDFGTSEVGPSGLGPFLITEFVEGVRMSDMILPPQSGIFEQMSPHDLDPRSEKIVFLYRQMAQYLTHLSRFNFDRIGALLMDGTTGHWSVTGRPLTLDTNLLVSQCGYPQEYVASSTFAKGDEYLTSLSEQQLRNFTTQRNAAPSPDTARSNYRARYLFKTLLDARCRDREYGKAPFKIYCENLCPGNIIVDPDTWEIKAFTNLSYSNVMPAEFSFDPPSWLMAIDPCDWIRQRCTLNNWKSLYHSPLEVWLAELCRFESRYQHLYTRSEDQLSWKMGLAWADGLFWLNLAARNSSELDVIFYEKLDELFFDGQASKKDLDDTTNQLMESLSISKTTDFGAYARKWYYRWIKR